MQSEATTEKTFPTQQETIAYLEHTLTNTLRDATQNWGVDAIRMTGIDATTHTLSEAGGDAATVSAEAITLLKNAGDHHVGIVITVGGYRLCIKVNPHSCRMTMWRPQEGPAASVPVPQPSDPQNPSGAESSAESGPTSPRPPGLSSGVPTPNVLPTSTPKP